MKRIDILFSLLMYCIGIFIGWNFVRGFKRSFMSKYITEMQGILIVITIMFSIAVIGQYEIDKLFK